MLRILMIASSGATLPLHLVALADIYRPSFKSRREKTGARKIEAARLGPLKAERTANKTE